MWASTYGATLGNAYKTASDISNAIVKALMSAGATKSDIESQSQNFQALSEYELKNKQSQTWAARVYDD
jgi:hypothetical protein